MNSPPPVRFPLGRNPRGGGVIAGVWLLALMALLTGGALHAPTRSSISVLLIGLTVFSLGVWLALRLRRNQAWAALVWNGAEWFLEKGQNNGATAAIAPPGIRFDGQHWLLLRTQIEHRRIWLWLGRSADPARWHALRCALYAQVSPPLAPG